MANNNTFQSINLHTSPVWTGAWLRIIALKVWEIIECFFHHRGHGGFVLFNVILFLKLLVLKKTTECKINNWTHWSHWKYLTEITWLEDKKMNRKDESLFDYNYIINSGFILY